MAVTGLPAHGVDVGERVRGRDLAVGVGVVDDGREEIESLHHREIVAQPEDGGVVRTGRPDEKIFMMHLGESAQHLREIGLAELGGSSGAGGQFGEAFDVVAGHGGRVAGIAGLR